MKREDLIGAINQDCPAGTNIYIGKNGQVSQPGWEKVVYTDEHEEGDYFYGPVEAFEHIYRNAKPLGVLRAGDDRIFWTDPSELAEDLKEALKTNQVSPVPLAGPIDSRPDADAFEELYAPKTFKKTETGHPYLLESYGKEYVKVLDAERANPKTVWTVVECENENLVICAGLRRVDSLNFIITKKPWVTGREEFLYVDASKINENEGAAPCPDPREAQPIQPRGGVESQTR